MKKIIAPIFLIIIIPLVALLARNTGSSTETVIRVGYSINSILHAPIVIAIEKGFFNKEGIKVVPVPLQSGKEIQQALGTGAIDFGFAAVTNYFVPISVGAPIKIVAFSDLSSTKMFVRSDSGIRTFEDLKGKKIAYRQGAGIDFGMNLVFNRENIKPSDVQFVDIDRPLRLIALTEKKIVDATTISYYEIDTYAKAGAIELPEWVEKGYDKFLVPKTVLAMNTNFSKIHTKETDEFVSAFIEAHAFIKNNTEEAAKIVSEHITKGTDGVISPIPSEIVKSWDTEDYIPTLWQDPLILVEMARVFADIGGIDRKLTQDEICDSIFEGKLKEADEIFYGNK